MSEMMKKVKAIPLGDISSFLAKNKYNEVECSEYQLGKEYTKVDIDSITDSFLGKIIGKKKTLMNADTSPVLDEDTITFGVKNGKTSDAKLFKRRVDSANGYTYLQNTINEDDDVYKIKAVLNKSQELLSFSICTIEKRGDVLNEEVTFDSNGKLDRIMVKSTSSNIDFNYENEFRFNNGSMNVISAPKSLMVLQSSHFGIYCILNNLKDGNYGFQCNEQQRKSIEETLDVFASSSPFKLEKIQEICEEI